MHGAAFPKRSAIHSTAIQRKQSSGTRLFKQEQTLVPYRYYEQVISLLLSRDELQLIIAPRIETQYMVKLGALEYRVKRLRFELQRIERIKQLALEQKQAGGQGSEESQRRQLEALFAQEQQALRAQQERVQAALKRERRKQLSDEELQVIRQVYRRIIAALHPMLHPKQAMGQRQMFTSAQRAYQNGDLETLHLIYQSLPASLSAFPGGKTTDAGARLLAQIRLLRQEIAKLKREYPYTLRARMADTARLEADGAALKQECEQLEGRLRSLRMEWE